MIFSRGRGLRFGHRLWHRGLSVLLPAVVLLWAVPGASATNRIYWSNFDPVTGDTISFANLNGTGGGGDLDTIGATLDRPMGTAMDLVTGKIYWPNFEGQSISFAKLNDTGGGGELTTTGASDVAPAGVATDPATGRIYWGDFSPNVIASAKLNNTGGGADLKTTGATVDEPDGVAVDPATGKIYWANYGNSTIGYANLDGSGHGGDLDTTGATVSNPTGVAIDPDNGKIYWANWGDDSAPISFAKLNDTGGGGDLNITGAGGGNASGVAIDPQAGKIYWGNPGPATLAYAKLNNTGGGFIDTTGATTPYEPQFPALLKAPRATAKPKIGGASTVGSKLTCSKGTWAPDLIESFLYQRPVSFSYAWSRNGTPIAGATTKSITASRAGTYSCTVTATNQAGGTQKTSKSHTVT